MENQHRHLAAILFTDIVGYTALMQENEQKAVALIKHYNTALNELVALHNGKILNYYGDGSLCSFPSVKEAMSCAVELQKELQTEPKVPLRIGLHVGEVFFENEKALGDGVNVASRIQSLGQENTIFFSKEIFDKIRNHPEFKPVSIGFFEFKNVDQPMEIFALANEGLNVPKKETLEGKLKTPLSKNNKSVRKKIIVGASVALLLIAGFFIYSTFFKKLGFTGKEKSIAVLPFASMGSDKESESFSMGISTEITNQLSRISSLTVRAASSTIRFKDEKNKTLKDIGAELNVAALVTGQFQIISNKIRVYVALTDVNSDKVIWSKDYPSDWQDIFAIQNAIAEQVAYELNTEMTKDEKKKIEKKPTDNPEAYKFYLQGNNVHYKFYETRSLELYANSKALFEKAISLDSNYALAHAALADLYNTKSKTDSQIVSLQIKEMNKAWEIDSTLDFVNYVKGQILYSVFGKNEEGYIYFRRAVEINSNNRNNLFGLAVILVRLGLYDESITLLNKAINLNPLSVADFGLLADNELFLYRLSDAVRDYQAALQLEPGFYEVIKSLIFVYSLQNKFDSAGMMLEKESRLRPADKPPTFQIAYYYAKSGNKKKALEVNTSIKDFRVYLALGMKEEALNSLLEIETSRRPFSNNYLFFKNHLQHKDFDLIRNDPRFLELLEKSRIQYELNKKKFNIAGILN